MIEPNWDYFIHAPLDIGTRIFRSKTERALYARLTAAAANWLELKTVDRLKIWLEARTDLEAFLNGDNPIF